MKHMPHIAITMAATARVNGWSRTSLTDGERYIRGDRQVHVRYAGDGRVRSATLYTGPNGTKIKGGRFKVMGTLERLGKNEAAERVISQL